MLTNTAVTSAMTYNSTNATDFRGSAVTYFRCGG